MISTIMMVAIMTMHRAGLALAKLMTGIMAKAVSVTLGLSTRHPSKSPKAPRAKMISRVLVSVRSSKTITKVISLLVMGQAVCWRRHW